MARKRISDELAAQIMFDSKFKCCICEDGSRGDQIHHIDGNSSNSTYDNLAFLCLKHHADASEKNEMRRKISARAVRKFRENWYKKIREERNINLKSLNKTVTKISQEELLHAALNANIIYDILQIEYDYHNSQLEDKVKLLNSLCKYRENIDYRIGYEVYNFLFRASSDIRFSNMPNRIASSIYWLISDFFVFPKQNKNNKQIITLGNLCIQIAENLIFFSAIYELKDLNSAAYGFNILKVVYKEGQRLPNKKLISNVMNSYTKLEEGIVEFNSNPKIEEAKLLLETFKDDIDSFSLAFPIFPIKIRKKALGENKNT